MTAGNNKNLSFAGVTNASVRAGTQFVEWGARCIGAGTAMNLSAADLKPEHGRGARLSIWLAPRRNSPTGEAALSGLPPTAR
jgi:hypothetical protein